MNGYEDIINLPHHQSQTRPHMPVSDRAAQFAPFAALTGYGDAVEESARLTEKRVELSEEQLCELDVKLALLAPLLAERPEVCVTYFRPDGKKEGGAYITFSGRLKKIDACKRALCFENGVSVKISDITDIN